MISDYERIKREFDLSLLEKLAQTVRQLPTVEDLWPVGSIYMSLDPTDPATRFGGVWERIENAFLLAASSAHPVGETGGEERHTLTVNEIPAHNHNIFYGINTDRPGWGVTVISNSDYIATGAMSHTGGDQPHNNMPPYLSVYMWKRMG